MQWTEKGIDKFLLYLYNSYSLDGVEHHFKYFLSQNMEENREG